MITIMALIIAAITGGGYAGYMFLKKTVDPTKPETLRNIDPFQLLGTAVVGMGVACGWYFAGVPIDQSSLEVQVTAYGFVTVLITAGIQAGWRWFSAWNAMRTRGY